MASAVETTGELETVEKALQQADHTKNLFRIVACIVNATHVVDDPGSLDGVVVLLVREALKEALGVLCGAIDDAEGWYSATGKFLGLCHSEDTQKQCFQVYRVAFRVVDTLVSALARRKDLRRDLKALTFAAHIVLKECNENANVHTFAADKHEDYFEWATHLARELSELAQSHSDVKWRMERAETGVKDGSADKVFAERLSAADKACAERLTAVYKAFAEVLAEAAK